MICLNYAFINVPRNFLVFHKVKMYEMRQYRTIICWEGNEHLIFTEDTKLLLQCVNLSTKGSATIFIFKINITFPIESSRYCTKKLQNYNPFPQSTLRLVS